MTAGLSSRQAAARLGVKVETLYAYVSRGILTRETSADGRSSTFDPRAVEELARRGRPRQSSRSTSLNMLIETRLTTLSPAGVRYRGLLSSELATTHRFEDVAELLWTGRLGATRRPWVGIVLQPETGMALGDALRVTAVRAAALLPPAGGFGPDDIAGVGRRLIATLADSLPHAGDGRVPRLALLGDSGSSSPMRGSIAGRLWTKLSPRRPAAGMLGVVNATLVLMADHDLAASTFAVRVAASTRADPSWAVSAGLGVLSGPLHGSASRAAVQVLRRAAEIGAGRAVGEILTARRRLPGFGHSVYVGADPRAVVLMDLLRGRGHSRAMTLADDVVAVVQARTDQHPNVDFALAALTMIAGMPDDGGEILMSVARIAGWLAHAGEEYAEQPLRFRPRASYIG